MIGAFVVYFDRIIQQADFGITHTLSIGRYI